MKVLMITGDRNFRAGNPRYDLQRSAVDELEVVYWGKEALLRNINISKYRNFDVVTVQDPFWRGLFAWQVARRLGCRFNVQVHTDLSAHSGARHIVAQIVLRHADTIRVVSEKIKQQVERIGVNAKITVLPVYVDISKFQNIERKSENNTILWIGRFEDEKDPLYALDVLKEVRKTTDAKLVMLGKGSLENSLRAEISRSQLAQYVELAGWQDPAEYLARAGVVLCTSEHESYGASIVESLAAAVPVVAPDVGIAREAGATVVSREHMAQKVAEMLQSGASGSLRIHMLTKDQWTHVWCESLL